MRKRLSFPSARNFLYENSKRTDWSTNLPLNLWTDYEPEFPPQYESSGDLVLKVINTSSQPVTATFNLEGAEHRSSEAKLTALTSEHPGDNNSLEDPTRVVRVSSRITGIDVNFTHSFPSYSLTVMRLGK